MCKWSSFPAEKHRICSLPLLTESLWEAEGTANSVLFCRKDILEPVQKPYFQVNRGRQASVLPETPPCSQRPLLRSEGQKGLRLRKEKGEQVRKRS